MAADVRARISLDSSEFTRGVNNAHRDMGRLAGGFSTSSRAGAKLAEVLARSGVDLGRFGGLLFNVEKLLSRGSQNSEAFWASFRGGAAASVAILSVSEAIKTANSELEKANKTAKEFGLKEMGFFDFLAVGVGLKDPQVDPKNMADRIAREVANLERQKTAIEKLQAIIERETKTGSLEPGARSRWREEYKDLLLVDELKKERKAAEDAGKAQRANKTVYLDLEGQFAAINEQLVALYENQDRLERFKETFTGIAGKESVAVQGVQTELAKTQVAIQEEINRRIEVGNKLTEERNRRQKELNEGADRANFLRGQPEFDRIVSGFRDRAEARDKRLRAEDAAEARRARIAAMESRGLLDRPVRGFDVATEPSRNRPTLRYGGVWDGQAMGGERGIQAFIKQNDQHLSETARYIKKIYTDGIKIVGGVTAVAG